jgi:hypothetical protein
MSEYEDSEDLPLAGALRVVFPMVGVMSAFYSGGITAQDVPKTFANPPK